MRYQTPGPWNRDTVLRELKSGERDRICAALVAAALHDADRFWLERVLVEHMTHDDPWVRGVAATCVGHVARIFRAVSLEDVRPALERLLRDPLVAGRAQEALEDIEIFTGVRMAQEDEELDHDDDDSSA